MSDTYPTPFLCLGSDTYSSQPPNPLCLIIGRHGASQFSTYFHLHFSDSTLNFSD